MSPESIQLRDIHPPLALAEAPNYLLWGAGFLGVLLLLSLLWWFLRHRKRQSGRPLPHETAMEDLGLARAMMTEERALQYADEVSAILRCYIEGRFSIQTSRQTTTEFFRALRIDSGRSNSLFSRHHCTVLKECLRQCDMAKFARCTPDMGSMKEMEISVRDFIEDTRETRQGGRE